MARRFLGDFEVTNNVLIGNTLTLSALTVSRALEIDGSGNVVSSSVTSTEMGYLAGVTSDIQTQLNAKQNTSEKGNANGYASLDGGGKIPASQLPNSVMEFQGGWNASTNTPTLIDGTGNAGDVYRASVAGSQDLGSGSQSWSIGDLVMYSGSIWEKAPASDAVSSVFGRTGAVAAASSDYDAVQIDYDNSSSSLTASDVQAAIDEVESRLDSAESNITANDGDITDIRSAVGISDGDTDMGTFTGSTISDNVSAKVGMQELETSLETKAASSVVTEIDANVDDLITLSGVAENSTDLGTFTGSTIADTQNNKQALQALETAVEARTVAADLSSTANAKGASLVGIEDSAGDFTATDVEGALAELFTAISAGSDDQTAAEVDYTQGTPGDWTVADGSSVKANLDEVGSRLTANESDLGDIRTTQGTSDGDTDMGTFTGSTISDNGSVKAGMQELETEVELKAATSFLASNSNGEGASSIGIEDASSQFTATDVEGALDEAIDAAQAAQSDIDDHKDGGASKHDGSEIDYERVDGSKKSIQAASDDVESAISDLDDFKADSSDLASTSNALGASLIGIEDSAGDFTATNVESALSELYTAIAAGTDDQIASEVPFTPGTNPNPEFITSPDFNAFTGWGDFSAGGNSASASGGQLLLNRASGSSDAAANQTMAGLTIGGNYTISIVVDDLADVGVVLIGNKGIPASTALSLGLNTINFTATGVNPTVSLSANSGGTGIAKLDSCSVKLAFSGLASTDVQAAIDELTPRVADLEQISAEGDLMIGDGSGDPSQLSIGAADRVLTSDGSTASWEIIGSPGDIKETSFSGANNQVSAASVTGLAFAAGVVRSFRVHGSIVIDATADLYEEFELYGIQRGSDFQMDDMRTGDNSGVVFSITAAGQVQYTSPNSAGFVSLDIKFRAITTSV